MHISRIMSVVAFLFQLSLLTQFISLKHREWLHLPVMFDKCTQSTANLVVVATCQDKGKSSGMVQSQPEAVRDIGKLPFARKWGAIFRRLVVLYYYHKNNINLQTVYSMNIHKIIHTIIQYSFLVEIMQC